MKSCDKHKDFAAPRDAALHDSEIVLFIESQLDVQIIWMFIRITLLNLLLTGIESWNLRVANQAIVRVSITSNL